MCFTGQNCHCSQTTDKTADKERHAVILTAKETAVAFSRQHLTTKCSATDLGITVREVGDLYQDYYHFPQGLYISYITPGSPAEQPDLQCGDIIQTVNGQPVFTETAFLEQIAGNEPLLLTIYRDGKTQPVSVAMTEVQ